MARPAVVYRHFPDRSELLAAVAAAGFAGLTARMAAAVDAAAGARARFLATGDAYVRFARDNPEYFRVMFGPYGRGPARAARGGDGSIPSAHALLVSALEGMLVAGVIGGPVADATLTAWSAAHGLSVLLVDRAVELDDGGVQAAVEHLTATVLRGLAVA